MSTVVEARCLHKAFAEHTLIDDVSFTIARGDVIALIGESGAGKSTLLNVIAGLESYDSGTLVVDDTPLAAGDIDPDISAALRRAKIGFVFQAFHLLPHLSVWQNVALPLLLTGTATAEARERAEAILARVGLARRTGARPATLSGGEMQRVALARSIAHEPILLLADEPTGNLDADTADTALTLLDEIVQETGCALLLVTHSDRAAAHCALQWRLAGGALHREATPR